MKQLYTSHRIGYGADAIRIVIHLSVSLNPYLSASQENIVHRPQPRLESSTPRTQLWPTRSRSVGIATTPLTSTIHPCPSSPLVRLIVFLLIRNNRRHPHFPRCPFAPD